jgi:hypothetical protein
MASPFTKLIQTATKAQFMGAVLEGILKAREALLGRCLLWELKAGLKLYRGRKRDVEVLSPAKSRWVTAYKARVFSLWKKATLVKQGLGLLRRLVTRVAKREVRRAFLSHWAMVEADRAVIAQKKELMIAVQAALGGRKEPPLTSPYARFSN